MKFSARRALRQNRLNALDRQGPVVSHRCSVLPDRIWALGH